MNTVKRDADAIYTPSTHNMQLVAMEGVLKALIASGRTFDEIVDDIDFRFLPLMINDEETIYTRLRMIHFNVKYKADRFAESYKTGIELSSEEYHMLMRLPDKVVMAKDLADGSRLYIVGVYPSCKRYNHHIWWPTHLKELVLTRDLTVKVDDAIIAPHDKFDV
jgi:hypothetical protein